MIRSCICAALAAASISSDEEPNLPYLSDRRDHVEIGCEFRKEAAYPILYPMLVLKRTESCGTTPIAFLRDS